MVGGSVRRVRMRVGRAAYSRRVDFCGVREAQGGEAGTKNYLRAEDGKCCFGGRCGSGALDMGWDRSSSPANAGAQAPANAGAQAPRTSTSLIPGPPPSRGNGMGRSSSSKTRAPPRQNLTTPAKAGAKWGTLPTERCASLLRPFHLGPGLRRGGSNWTGLSCPPYPSIIVRICVASASIAKGFVIIDMPGSRKPDASAAFSA